MNDKSICQNDCVKFLGIQLDGHLSWQKHIESVLKNLASKNFAILQIRNSVDSVTLMTLYYGCVNSILSYGLLCWGNCPGVQKVFLMQKRIIRSMFNLGYTTSCKPYFRKHGILTVYCMYILQAVCYVWKNIDKLPKCSDINNYITRSSRKIYIPACRLTQVNKGPFITSCKMYNLLPKKLKDASSFNCFKSAVRKFLIKECFYTFHEYNIFCTTT